jgi:hypothetical protein
MQNRKKNRDRIIEAFDEWSSKRNFLKKWLAEGGLSKEEYVTFSNFCIENFIDFEEFIKEAIEYQMKDFLVFKKRKQKILTDETDPEKKSRQSPQER